MVCIRKTCVSLVPHRPTTWGTLPPAAERNQSILIYHQRIIYSVVEVTSNSEPLKSNEDLLDLPKFQLTEAEEVSDTYVANHRVKRADVSKIRHLINEERIYQHYHMLKKSLV